MYADPWKSKSYRSSWLNGKLTDLPVYRQSCTLPLGWVPSSSACIRTLAAYMKPSTELHRLSKAVRWSEEERRRFKRRHPQVIHAHAKSTTMNSECWPGGGGVKITNTRLRPDSARRLHPSCTQNKKQKDGHEDVLATAVPRIWIPSSLPTCLAFFVQVGHLSNNLFVGNIPPCWQNHGNEGCTARQIDLCVLFI